MSPEESLSGRCCHSNSGSLRARRLRSKTTSPRPATCAPVSSDHSNPWRLWRRASAVALCDRLNNGSHRAIRLDSGHMRKRQVRRCQRRNPSEIRHKGRLSFVYLAISKSTQGAHRAATSRCACPRRLPIWRSALSSCRRADHADHSYLGPPISPTLACRQQRLVFDLFEYGSNSYESPAMVATVQLNKHRDVALAFRQRLNDALNLHIRTR